MNPQESKGRFGIKGRCSFVDKSGAKWDLKPMPRQARIDVPGALHHIIIRGMEGRSILRDDSLWRSPKVSLRHRACPGKTGLYNQIAVINWPDG